MQALEVAFKASYDAGFDQGIRLHPPIVLQVRGGGSRGSFGVIVGIGEARAGEVVGN